jgi:nitroreductase
MDTREALRTRRSNGAFGSSEPPSELVARAIEAATWAPNHHLTEPWAFHVLRGGARAALAEAAADTLPPERDTPAERAALRTKLERAPVVVVMVQRAVPEDPVRALEDYAACACATQNLLLAAHADGLAAKWSTGKLARSPGAAAYLGLGRADRIVAYVYLGYSPAPEPPREPRRSAPVVIWHD